jgi:hypothetical protein
MFYEIVVAPGYTEKGLEVLKRKSKTLRILEAQRSGKGMLSLRQVNGGWLAQESDDLTPEAITFTKMSERAPEGSELSDARFAWLCVKHVKSNAIVIAKVSSARILTFLCSANSKRIRSLDGPLIPCPDGRRCAEQLHAGHGQRAAEQAGEPEDRLPEGRGGGQGSCSGQRRLLPVR